MAESVVKYFPAMNSASSFPAVINRRREAADIELSGKANWAATSRRNGVVGVTVPGAGRFFTVDHSAPGMNSRCGLLGRQRTCLPSCPILLPPDKNFFDGAGNQPHHRR
jgi:hypothetical protein